MGERETVHMDTEMDIKGVNWLAKVKPLLDLYDETSKIQDPIVKKIIIEKIAGWAGMEAFTGFALEAKVKDAVLLGHPSLATEIPKAMEKIREIISENLDK